ncbi:MAG: porin [Nitrospira sp.]|nr:porin [Nitrospira sp.]
MSKSIVNAFVATMLWSWGVWTGGAFGQSLLTGTPLGEAPTPVFSAQTPGLEGRSSSDPLWTDALWHADEKGINRFFPQDGFLRVRGWVDGGYTYNASNPRSNFSGPYNAIDRDIPVLNQLYMIVEKPLTATGSNWGIGGRLDFMYGYDYFLTQSNGVERRENGAQRWNAQGQHYGLAMPQAYAEIGNQTFSVKVGHFYTIIGYEGVPSINNFFYSKSFAYQFAGPFTHWGGLATWHLNDRITLQGGLVNGWDSLDRTKDSTTGLASIKYTAPENLWSLSFSMVTGNEPNAVATQFETRTRYSLIFTAHPAERWEYVFHHHYAYQNQGKVDGGTARWYGIDNYLYYALTDQWRAGLRFEWMRDEAGTRVGGNPVRDNPNLGPFAGSFYSLSAGLNYRPHPNVLIRPEVRADWFDGQRSPYNDGLNKNQVLAAINGTLQF